jgi:hypothetical protein
MLSIVTTGWQLKKHCDLSLQHAKLQAGLLLPSHQHICQPAASATVPQQILNHILHSTLFI